VNRVIALRSASGTVSYYGRRSFAALADSTRITFDGEVRLPGALRMVEPLAVRLSGGQVDRDLDAVRRRVEQSF
jgi:hypothetical protein